MSLAEDLRQVGELHASGINILNQRDMLSTAFTISSRSESASAAWRIIEFSITYTEGLVVQDRAVLYWFAS